MKRITFLGVIIALLFVISACNDSNTTNTKDVVAEKEAQQLDSLTVELEKTEQEIEAKSKTLDDALNDLEID